MPPLYSKRNLGIGQQTDYEQWATEMYGTRERLTENPSNLPNVPQVKLWNEPLNDPHADFQSAGAYLSSVFQLPSREQSIALVLVSGLLVVVLVLLHILKAKR